MAGPSVVVVGGGVSGLTCAVALLEAGADVLVRTAASPLGTVSAVAGAMLGPVVDVPGDPSTGWMRTGIERFTALADDPATGVSIKRGRLVSAPELGPGLPTWAERVRGFAELSAEELPGGYVGGFRAELPFADMTRYLPWLVVRVGELGGRVVQDVVADLPGAAEGADVVVNCSGLAARRLAQDESVEPIWGQHLIVRAPEVQEFTFEGGGSSGEGMGITPHPRGVLLGGIRIPGRYDLVPDDAVSAGIRSRCAAVLPELADAPLLAVEVGLRPGRPSVRLEAETIDGVRVVHDYGHGGNGVQWSWGCAADVVRLVLG